MVNCRAAQVPKDYELKAGQLDARNESSLSDLPAREPVVQAPRYFGPGGAVRGVVMGGFKLGEASEDIHHLLRAQAHCCGRYGLGDELALNMGARSQAEARSYFGLAFAVAGGAEWARGAEWAE